MLACVRETSVVFAQSREPQSRALRLGDFHRQVHFLTGAAEMAGCRRLAHLAAALEALLFELQERPRNISPSTFYTIKSAIDLLGELFARAARGEPESIPPSHLLAALVVDDEPLATRAVMQALNRANVKPTSAAAAPPALELLNNYRYDLLLVDYVMPGMDGLELYERMRALPAYAKTPVIFVTSQADFKEAHPEIIARGDDVITKPVLPVELAVKSLTLLFKSRLDELPAAAEPGPTAGRVLVVDDQPLVREFVKLLLTQEGYEVETAGGSGEALANFAPGKFDLAVVDLEMPEVKGDELAGLLKARAPHLPVIMLTGHGEKAFARGQMPAGVDHVITKPFRLEALREAIATARAACAARAAKS
jgi:CheY-like chemotaxis protein